MALSFTYDPATPVGRVRLLIRDNDFSVIGASLIESRDTWTCSYEDSEIQAILGLEFGSVYATAARLLEGMANSIGAVVPVRLISWSSDPQAAATALRNGAAELRERSLVGDGAVVNPARSDNLYGAGMVPY